MPEFTAGERVAGRRSQYVVGERLGEGGFGLAFAATAGGVRDSIGGGLRWAVVATLRLGVFVVGVFPAL